MRLLHLFIITFCAIGTQQVLAEPIEARDAAVALIGKTWNGTNAKGEDFWFWHEGDEKGGEYFAIFSAAPDRIHSGAWKRDGTAICWNWPRFGGDLCYVLFQRNGEVITMTRRDGEVHSGTLSTDKFEGFLK